MVIRDRSRLWKLWRLVPHRRLSGAGTRCWRCGYHYNGSHKEL